MQNKSKNRGECNALFAANVVDFETGVKIVIKRGELMGKVSGEGMATIIEFEYERICHIHK